MTSPFELGQLAPSPSAPTPLNSPMAGKGSTVRGIKKPTWPARSTDGKPRGRTHYEGAGFRLLHVILVAVTCGQHLDFCDVNRFVISVYVGLHLYMVPFVTLECPRIVYRPRFLVSVAHKR